jgi:chromosome segregation ATPase
MFTEEHVRAAIVALEKDATLLKQENSCLRATLDSERAGRKSLEQRLVSAEAELVSYKLQLETERSDCRQLRNEVSFKFSFSSIWY